MKRLDLLTKTFPMSRTSLETYVESPRDDKRSPDRRPSWRGFVGSAYIVAWAVPDLNGKSLPATITLAPANVWCVRGY